MIKDVAMLNVNGAGMVGAPGSYAKVFDVLGKNNINVMMISTAASEANISMIIKRGLLGRAVSNLEIALLERGGIVSEVTTEDDVAVIASDVLTLYGGWRELPAVYGARPMIAPMAIENAFRPWSPNPRLLSQTTALWEQDYREICTRLDPDRYYHINSPYGGPFVNDPLRGDSHGYTHIWYVPGAQYPVFLTENTRVSMPLAKSIKRFVGEKEFWPEGFTGVIQRARR